MGNRVAAAAVLLMLAAACSRSDLDLPGTPGGDASAAGDAMALGDAASDTASDGASPGDAGPTHDAFPSRDASPLDGTLPPPDSGTAPGCGPTTCAESCCFPDGTCAPADNDQACGYGGEACTVCATDEFCKGGCVHFQDNCGPGNCPGCCEDVNICAAGVSDTSCGHAGEVCQRCVPQEGTGQCVQQPGGGGLCNNVQSCNAANCTGCCSGNVCVVGDSESDCGSNGAACAACPAGQACALTKAAYECVPLPCDPSTCGGCCDALICAVGDQDVACGSGGAACTDCAASGRMCTQGACH